MFLRATDLCLESDSVALTVVVCYDSDSRRNGIARSERLSPVKYDVQLKPGAVKDIKGMPTGIQSRVLARIEAMSTDLRGDVKRLTGFTGEYRLRVGDYRVLFEIEGKSIVVYRVRHRREAYR
jgi:mRNA interferase RelE/StbE